MTYANKTSVAPEKSRAEIENTLSRYGATGFAYGTEIGRAMIGNLQREQSRDAK